MSSLLYVWNHEQYQPGYLSILLPILINHLHKSMTNITSSIKLQHNKATHKLSKDITCRHQQMRRCACVSHAIIKMYVGVCI